MEQGSTRPVLQQYVLGTAGLGGVWGTIDPEVSVRAMVQALEAGIPAIDTAPAYGDGELLVGNALRQWKGPRPEISTKVGRLKGFAPDQGLYDYTPDGMTRSVENSLELLGLPRVDTLFLHEPEAIPEPEIGQAVATMVRFKQNGYARRIGLGGNYPTSFLRYLDTGIFDVVMEFNRLNACCTDALDSSLPGCYSRSIAYWAASPLHMGLLGRNFRSFTGSRPAWLQQRYIDAASALNETAVARGLSLSSLALRFLQNIPIPVTVVIGPSDQAELADCLAAILQGPLENSLYQEIIRNTKNK